MWTCMHDKRSQVCIIEITPYLSGIYYNIMRADLVELLQSVVRAPDLWLKGLGFKSWQEGQKKIFSMVNFLCWLLFQYLFHSRVTAVAHKRSHSFCQKCRWQLTVKHTGTICTWLCRVHHTTVHHVVVLVHADASATHNILINLMKPLRSCWCQSIVTQPQSRWYTIGELFHRPVLVLAFNYR